MAKRRAYSLTAVGLIALAVGLAFNAEAGLTLFSTRESWQAAQGSGPQALVDFNSPDLLGVSFGSTAYNFGAFTLRALETAPPNTDQIVPSNSSPFASMFVDETHSVALKLNVSALGFGAEFSSSGLVNFGVLLPQHSAPIFVEGPQDGFLGIVSTEPIEQITFVYNGPVGQSTTFGMDDVGIASATPEPSSLMLLGTGAGLFTVYSGWRLRRGKGAVRDQA